MTEDKKITPFDFINDISGQKEYIFSEDTERAYSNYLVNRGLSQHIDTILLANEMNKRPSIDSLMHHDFLFYAVSKKKRYGKWARDSKENEESLQLIMTEYCVNRSVAQQYMAVLDKSDIKALKTKYSNQGKSK